MDFERVIAALEAEIEKLDKPAEPEDAAMTYSYADVQTARMAGIWRAMEIVKSIHQPHLDQPETPES